MRLSVLVPTLKRPKLLRRNLEGLALQSRQPDEILVFLRVKHDLEGVATVEAFEEAHPNINLRKITTDEIGTIIFAENSMIKAATGDVCCFLDDDAVPRPFWLENIARHYEADTQVGGVAGPPINNIAGTPDEKTTRLRNLIFWPGFILDRTTRHTATAVECDHFCGANMSFRADVLKATGGFDPRLRGDVHRLELPLGFMCKRMGLKMIMDPLAEVDHYEDVRHDDFGSRFDSVAVCNNAANETYIFLCEYGPFSRIAHLFYAFLVGNFANPGLAWAVFGTLMRPFWKSRFLLGMGAMPAAWRGRILGQKMYREALSEEAL
ncbi:MAG: glycosyltransferase [Planctomycetes bacterium]|jgi:GT2 family glycosyltransferase|nr:glycosyltransferase [Planctomycetota bacterium]MBT4029635.1 glycosyltransferase [Planctomycetota bacterium]MBT4560170.1 glycosyltransferase [Planctomycetota bacterium]MBT5100906.1 glycosyltransferase [Planctomycetota bacterium]MBT7011463.1 glycosyltransferase [Planctomycetota bacterium]